MLVLEVRNYNDVLYTKLYTNVRAFKLLCTIANLEWFEHHLELHGKKHQLQITSHIKCMLNF